MLFFIGIDILNMWFLYKGVSVSTNYTKLLNETQGELISK